MNLGARNIKEGGETEKLVNSAVRLQFKCNFADSNI